MQDKILQEVEYTSLNGESARLTERIIVETPLAIRVNGKNLATAMITAMMEKEFVTGFLFGRGIIGSADDIESLEIRDNTAEVRVRGDAPKGKKKKTSDSELTVRKEDIFDCVRAILKSDIFEETEAVHSAGLFRNGSEAICITEDLGRRGLAAVRGARLHPGPGGVARGGRGPRRGGAAGGGAGEPPQPPPARRGHPRPAGRGRPPRGARSRHHRLARPRHPGPRHGRVDGVPGTRVSVEGR